MLTCDAHEDAPSSQRAGRSPSRAEGESRTGGDSSLRTCASRAPADRLQAVDGRGTRANSFARARASALDGRGHSAGTRRSLMLVIDASALGDLLLGDNRVADTVAGQDLHAPHLVDVEVLSALRRLVAAGTVQPARAAQAVTDLL